jgi:ubiquinone/menaquinone biosynthesis C-methylase UbiE
MSAVESAFCRSAPWQFVARRVMLPWALAGTTLQGDVLEIGGGGGAMAAATARRFADARVTVTDVDPDMVFAAQRRLDGTPNAGAALADVTRLPYADASFDAVTSYLMLHHVLRWEQAVAEAYRVLRPGGVFVGYDLTDSRTSRLIHRLDRSPHRLVAPEALTSQLRAVGFVSVRVEAAGRGVAMRFAARKAA